LPPVVDGRAIQPMGLANPVRAFARAARAVRVRPVEG